MLSEIIRQSLITPFQGILKGAGLPLLSILYLSVIFYQMDILLKIYLIILSISFLSSLLLIFRKIEFRFLRFFAPFLLLTLVIEIIGAILRKSAYNQVYNIFFVIEFNFYFFILIHFARSKRIQKILAIVMVVYTILSVLNFVFIQGLTYVTYTTCLGAFLIVIFCIYLFNEIFKGETLIFGNPKFWICLGLIIFYACTLPIMAGIYVMLSIPQEEWKFVGVAHILANYFLYTCFTIAFIFGAFTKKSALN